MGVDLLFRIAGIGILVAVLNQVLTKSGRDEQAMLITLAGLVVVLAIVIKEIVNLFNTIKAMFNL